MTGPAADRLISGTFITHDAAVKWMHVVALDALFTTFANHRPPKVLTITLASKTVTIINRVVPRVDGKAVARCQHTRQQTFCTRHNQ